MILTGFLLIVSQSIVALPALPKAAQTAPRVSRSAPRPAKKSKAKKAEIKSGWISVSDYPKTALRNGESGVSVATFVIGTDGRIRECTATGATQLLNEQTCLLLQTRFVFEPARDVSGKVTEETRVQRIKWVIPEEAPVASPAYGNGEMTLKVSELGKVIACTISRSSGDPVRDDKACKLALDRWTFVPASDASGNAIASERSVPIPLPSD